MELLSNIKNINLKNLLEILFNDLGINIEKYITDIVDSEISSIKIKTSYSSYVINFSDGKEETSQSINTNQLLPKIITIDSGSLINNKEKVKYFLRRQFIADEGLFNLYLKRGKVIRPCEAQENALLGLQNTRESGFNKALVILATGLGKTMLSALDAKATKSDKILFIVHVNEILKQTKESFERVLPERKNEMGFYNGKQKDKEKKILFASIQTMGKQKHIQSFPSDYFDYIIIDETHHTAAPTYGKIFDYFKPKFFLGLTATPDRTDKKDILNFYDKNVVFEMGQEDAIEQGYLVPFKYLGFKDDIDYSNIYFNGFKYDVKDLNKHLLIDIRDTAIIDKFKELAGNRKSIGFCASIEHADRSAQKFRDAGINAIAIHSRSLDKKEIEDEKKETPIKQFRQGKYQIAFVVDMFNEGIDIPDVSCLLFLRPTESKTIFIQHMGRGLRISPKKDNLLILDFIGNYRTSNLILEGLNIKNGIRGLKKIHRDGKDLFVYEINGCEVTFESEIINIFKSNEAIYIKEVRNEVISKEWIEYSNYLEKWTKDNLYWKRGQQNQYFEVNFEALKIIKDNPNIKEEEFINKIQKIVENKYPRKNMTAGFRSLMLSKISGFVSAGAPLKTMPTFDEIYKRTEDFNDLNTYKDILTNQLEKILYWNPIYGSYNKYVESTKRVSFNDFKIYPFFFIYSVMISLIDEYGSEPFISKFEFDTFLSITKEHSEVQEVVERILKYRNDSEKHQITKLLNSKNNIDSRFYGIVHYCKYLEQDRKGIRLRNEYIDEIRIKTNKFKDLYSNNKLVMYDGDFPEKYQNMLYSNSSLLKFHELE